MAHTAFFGNALAGAVPRHDFCGNAVQAKLGKAERHHAHDGFPRKSLAPEIRIQNVTDLRGIVIHVKVREAAGANHFSAFLIHKSEIEKFFVSVSGLQIRKVFFPPLLVLEPQLVYLLQLHYFLQDDDL